MSFELQYEEGTQRPSRFSLRKFLQDPAFFFAIAVIGILLFLLIVYPLLSVVTYPTLETWRKFLTQARYIKVLGNSVLLAILTTFSSTLVGFCFAYALTREDFPFKGFFRTISILPLISPPFVTGLALILLFGRQGLITHALLGLDVSVYGLFGLWFAQTIAYYPVAALTLSGVLKSINPTLEYAARDLGQSEWGIFKTITLPLITPGIASAALLVSMYALSDFGNPMVIGGPFRVLATEAYMQVTGMYNLPMAAVVSFFLLIPSLCVFLLQRYWVGRKQYETVTGKGGTLEPPPTPAIVKYSLLIILLIVSLLTLAIFAVVVYGAFTKTWGVDWSFTLANFSYTLLSKTRDIWNSLSFALLAALGTALFATFASYIIYRKRFFGRKVLDLIAVLPGALPGTMVGIAYILAFNQKPLLLTGTATIVILSMIVRNIPFGYRNSLSVLHQIDESIEESAADLGANTLRTFKDIMLPLLKSAFSTTIVYVFIKSVNTVSAAIFLVSPKTNIATTSILGLSEHGYWGQAAAMATILIGITLLTTLVFEAIGGKEKKLFDF
ncbi:MAG: iron(III) transport system permease protein [Candidatus Atribacteria bacterium]|nr:iron(III) transport system permease protein [Candidatus Atribacteria bacterium]